MASPRTLRQTARPRFRARCRCSGWYAIALARSRSAGSGAVPARRASTAKTILIVNLVDDAIEVYTMPRGKVYAMRRTVVRGDSITLVAFPT